MSPAITDRPQVFVSFAYEDQQVAKRLTEALQSEGAHVWTPEELNVVGRTLDGVRETIRRSHLFLLLITPAALRSNWVATEMSLALELTSEGERAKIAALLVGTDQAPAELDRFRTIQIETDNWRSVARHLLRSNRQHQAGAGAGFEEQVRKALQHSEVSVIAHPAVAGLRPDFLLTTRDGRSAVIEAKARSNPSLLETVIARTEAARTAEAIGAEHSFVVFATVAKELAGAGITDLSRLARDVQAWLAVRSTSVTRMPHVVADRRQDDLRRHAVQAGVRRRLFIAARQAAAAIGATCTRIDQEDFVGDVTEEIRAQITSSSAVIADLSEANPNVMYEVGFADALRKPTVLICSTPLSQLPFDVRNLNALEYTKGAINRLVEPLERRLRTALNL